MARIALASRFDLAPRVSGGSSPDELDELGDIDAIGIR
jgi:hypothetical protein